MGVAREALRRKEGGAGAYISPRKSLSRLLSVLQLPLKFVYGHKSCLNPAASLLTRFRRTSEVDLIPGPEQSFDIVGGYFSADLKSSLSHSLNMHFL